MKLIALYGTIGAEITSAAILAEVLAAGAEPITARINSNGGDVFEAYAIFNAFANHAPGVTIEIDGLAASAASYIAMAGKPLRMAENAMLMIHDPSSGQGGNADALRNQADLLDKVKVSLVNAYAGRTGLEATALDAMLTAETYLTADEALAQKFIDEIIKPLEAAAKFDLKALKNPAKVTAHLTRPTAPILAARLSAAEVRATTAESLVATSAAQIAAAQKERDTAATSKAALVGAVASTLILDDAAKTKLEAGDVSVLSVAITARANKEAVTIIASQGGPALKTKPPVPGEKPLTVAAHNAAAVAALLHQSN